VDRRQIASRDISVSSAEVYSQHLGVSVLRPDASVPRFGFDSISSVFLPTAMLQLQAIS
jgi:hypothetical protein